MMRRLLPPLAFTPLASLLACMFLSAPCKAEEPAAAPDPYPQKTARFSIEVKKETYHEMLASLPGAKISADREKIIEDLVRHIGRNAPEIAADRHAGIAADICDKTILPLLAPRIEQFNSLMVSAATDDKVSAGFLAFKGLADGMAEDDDLAGVTVYGNFTYRKADTEGEPELEWKWDTNLVGSNNSTRYLSAKIDETPTVDLQAYGVDKTFDFPITCEGKVGLKKTYQDQYYLFEKPRGKTKTSVSLTPEVEITASKNIESNYSGFFKVEGEESSSLSKTIKYDAALHFEFDADPQGE
jgi:hypothetical protein